ncbi:MAG: hypothetical protein PHG67_14255 [Bacteroidales bacterium]|nr:hypothetical protein [Bacteroidales bacterium]
MRKTLKVQADSRWNADKKLRFIPYFRLQGLILEHAGIYPGDRVTVELQTDDLAGAQIVIKLKR